MLETALPSPNIGSKGHHLRRLVARVISDMEISAVNYTGGAGVAGKHPSAKELSDFFAAAKTAADALVVTGDVGGDVGV